MLEFDGPHVKDLISTLKAHHTLFDPTVALYETFLNTKPLDSLSRDSITSRRNCVRRWIARPHRRQGGFGEGDGRL